MEDIERVARAICFAAGSEVHKVGCLFCVNGRCALWTSFGLEAQAALKALDDKYPKGPTYDIIPRSHEEEG